LWFSYLQTGEEAVSETSAKEKEIREFMQKFVKHGMGCGEQIAKFLQKKHPNAVVYPLYRSAVAIEYDEKERSVKFFTAGDPHVFGKDLIEKNIHETEYLITGNRFTPFLYIIRFGKAINLREVL